ncbi:hypothetical protein AVEN_229857-1 [Araneus ventricosus]|uniref:Uncharacterized protein n=1 Tax=Araneus ventricosus TaxID=182803 RepID=A0A4Y2SE22_ARAVE|nr:hypothetical protein AVEN_229857-1 [Araneus ventricosus]
MTDSVESGSSLEPYGPKTETLPLGHPLPLQSEDGGFSVHQTLIHAGSLLEPSFNSRPSDTDAENIPTGHRNQKFLAGIFRKLVVQLLHFILYTFI